MISLAPGDLDHLDAHAAQARAELRDARARAGVCVQCGDPAYWTLCGDCEATARAELKS